MSDLQAHPYADKFPLLADAELAELVESIRANGLRHKIVLTADGLILDGRNRYRACKVAGVEPVFDTYKGADLAEFVIDANATRRNQSTGARAMSTALVLAEDGRRIDGRWKRGSVKNDQKSDRSDGFRVAIANAGTVIDHAPDLAESVAAGDLALDAAYRQACGRRDEATRKAEQEARRAVEEAEAEAFITAHDLALAGQVGGAFETYLEALDVWNRRNREEADRLHKEKAAAVKAQRDRDAALTDLYSGIARAVQTCSGYGRYADIGDLWSEFEFRHLNPPQFEEVLTVEHLDEARRLIDWLTAWSKENHR